MNRGNEIGYLVLTRVDKWRIVVLNRQGRDLKASAEYLCQNIPSVTPRGYYLLMRFSSEVISLSFHIQFGCLSILTKNFRAAFTTKDKKRCKPSSLDLFNAHLRQRSQYGVQTNIFEELRMLPSTKIMVSENFNPTLGTKGFFSRAVGMLRGRPQAVRMKSLWHQGQFWSELDHEISKTFQKSYFVGFCPSRSLEVSVLLLKSQVLKQGFLRSLSVLLATPSLWELTICLKRTQI